ncbi:MAG TPA: tRNA (adenosine(37)-N6)-threonylcarbamoyltransferase complex ATPase subunit type 1 TsaE [Micavibrio sp.]|nr:tRNA (adenosine(37)-N6)-threonylcarbamoyltransferase complex ATPase subunit type 1 TsaE [Micavibrio sp.]HIL29559.1 tRNA (adenosine(37)-N6)-threonylcarbamoyltransferase complex ATPase subunit type 1 TsaE [Micavibrio sp.]
MEFTSRAEQDTIALAQKLSGALRAPAQNRAIIILLSGTLGMGKSVFARALIRALCNNETMDVPSPTYTLVQQYEADDITLRHFDLYRLEDPEEVYELGWEEALSEGISLIEWPERLGDDLHTPHLHITITSQDENTRKLTMTAAGDLYTDLLGLLAA